MNQNTDCTFLLSTYDGGEDLWEGFFKALSVQWPEMDMKIIINTETKQYRYPGFDIEVCNQTTKEEQPWATRLINSLKQVNTEYVLFFLEDFWLAERVDDSFFRKTLQWMKENPDVANFSYYPCLPGKNIQDERFERFEKRPQKCPYKYNCQVGLWRTKELISFFKPDESPWEWECFGSLRAGRSKQVFYSLKKDAPLVFSYGDNLKGCIIHRGKWVKDEVLPLAEKYGLTIDYSIRGFEDFDAYWKSSEHMGIREKLKRGKFLSAIPDIISKYYHTWKALK